MVQDIKLARICFHPPFLLFPYARDGILYYSFMDLRSPLLDVDDDNAKRDTHPSPPWRRQRQACSKTEYTPSTVTNEAIHPTLYEIIIRRQLCKMHLASIVLELGSESRFTGITLFHRYVREFYRYVVVSVSTTTSSMTTAEKPTSNSNSYRKCRRAIEFHLSNVASACIFLGCKMEEETRRIRDVVNLSHMLNTDDDDNVSDDDDNLTTHDFKSKRIITIIESARPPPLDEKYWKTKENLVSVEQHVLRMIRFDTSVCHPHRCVLVIMETLGFGVGRSKWGDNIISDEEQIHNNEKWLMQPDQSENVILTAFHLLNDAALDESGEALCHSVIVLSCAAISLAAVVGVDENVGALKDNVNDCRMAANYDNGEKVKVILPNHWWRALDVSTTKFTNARDALTNRIEVEMRH